MSSSLPTEKIVILALPGIGDALLATPMLEILRAERPRAEIHAVVMFAATRDMFSRDRSIDRVHYYDLINGSKAGALRFLAGLRRERFDLSINIYPQNRREYNLIAFAIGAKKRYAVRYLRRDAQNLSWVNSKTVTEDDRLHCVEENVRLLTLLGIERTLDEAALPSLRLTLDTEHEAMAEEWFIRHGIDRSGTIIGFHAGTALFKNHIMRRWAPAKFAELAVRLKAELGATVLLFGGPDDVEANQAIRSAAGDAILPVETKSILESVAIMKRLGMFVSNDSALMHIAGALGLPTVAIFGPTNETYVHPWRTRYTIVHTDIECRPCFVYSPKPLTCYRENPQEHFRCIRDIEVEQVMEAVRGMLR